MAYLAFTGKGKGNINNCVLGNRYANAASKPIIAPEAPTAGSLDNNNCASPAARPQAK